VGNLATFRLVLYILTFDPANVLSRMLCCYYFILLQFDSLLFY